MLEVYENRSVCDTDVVTNSLYNLMKNDYWLNAVNIKPKVRTYVLFKSEFETENYIKYYMSKRNRSLLAQFRLGILPLHLELGRFSNTPLDGRTCNICKSNDIEN